jgi:hypothetical protein
VFAMRRSMTSAPESNNIMTAALVGLAAAILLVNLILAAFKRSSIESVVLRAAVWRLFELDFHVKSHGPKGDQTSPEQQ